MLDDEGERTGDDKAQVMSMEIGIWTRVEEVIEDDITLLILMSSK